MECCACSASSLFPLSIIEESCVLIGSYFQTLSGVLHIVSPPQWFECCVLIGSCFQTISGVLRMFGLLIGSSFKYWGVLHSDWYLFPDAEWSAAYVRPPHWFLFQVLRSPAFWLVLISRRWVECCVCSASSLVPSSSGGCLMRWAGFPAWWLQASLCCSHRKTRPWRSLKRDKFHDNFVY